MSQELQNIPFYWTALSHFLTCAGMILIYRGRFGKWKSAALMALFFLLGQGIMYVTAPLHALQFNLGMAAFAVMTAVQLWALAPLSPLQTLYYGSRLFIYSGFMASISWQVYIFYSQRQGLLAHGAGEAVFMLLSYGVLLGLMLLLEQPHRKISPELRISTVTALTTLGVSLLFYILSSLSFSRLETPFGGSTYAEAFNIRTLVYLAGVAMLYAVHVQLCESHLATERDALENMLDMQYKSYQLGQESIELVNRKYHDMKHQIAILRDHMPQDQKLEVLDRVEQEIRVYESMNKTGNEILDTILTAKSFHCQQAGIALTCVADGKLLDFMEIVDISVLFGNALDNAIEAVSRIPEPEQRLIHLSVSQHQGFVRIRLENRYQGRVRMRNGFPVTTKADARNHGYGVKSIAATAEKYGGSLTMKTRDGWFELRILIPRQDPSA